MAFYLVQWGGAANDKSYKYAGSLEITGPFDTDSDAWDFSGIWDDDLYGSEFRGPIDFAVLEGTITSGTGMEDRDPIMGGSGQLCTPEERLRAKLDLNDRYDEDDDPRDCLDTATLRLLDRWWPAWYQDFQEEASRQARYWAERQDECEAQGHQWQEGWLYFVPPTKYRTCRHCGLHEDLNATDEEIATEQRRQDDQRAEYAERHTVRHSPRK